jgi:hypothetical protein
MRLSRFAGIWTAASLLPTVVLLFIGQPFWADWVLDARGVTTWGEVLSEKALPNDHHDGGTSIIDIRVRFHDRQGRAFILERYHAAGSWVIPVEEHLGLQRRGEPKRALVEYDPEDPSLNRLKGTSASVIGYWVFMPMFFVLVGLVLLGFALYMARRDRAVLS